MHKGIWKVLKGENPMAFLYMSIRKTVYGAWSIYSNFGYDRDYMGYSKREAIKKYREEFNAKGRHIYLKEW